MSLLHEPNVISMALMMSLLVLTFTVSTTLAQSFLRRRRRGNELESQRQWSRKLADASFDGLLIHRAGTVLQMNSALVRLLGWRERELVGNHFANLARPEDIPALRIELEAPRPLLTQFILLSAGKTEIAVEISSHTIEHEQMPATVTAIRDITQRRADAARIVKLSHYDPLTGLPNRKLFCDTLLAKVAENDRHGGATALLLIDIDQLKTINDQLGRQGGDQLLKQISVRIAALTAEADTLGRLGGDKFAVALPTPNAASATSVAAHFAAQLEAAVSQPFVVDGQLANVSLSAGIALYPEHAADADGLMKAAGFALKQANRAGGGLSHMFSPGESAGFQAAAGRALFRAGLTETQRLSQDLRQALAGGEISLVYQPIFRTADLTLTGYEALARWNHKADGLIGPTIFIPLAEQAGLIHEIGSFVLEAACQEAAASKASQKMSVNISPLQFRDPNLPARITAILRKTGLDPARLELEVTESLLIENAAAAAQALAALATIGVTVALDDFGTGYSSLSYLCDYPFTRLKIDKRFIQAIGTDANADAVVIAILSLARNLHLEVTAEGVETEAQLQFLQKIGCPQVQGFLLGRPGAIATVNAAAVATTLSRARIKAQA